MNKTKYGSVDNQEPAMVTKARSTSQSNNAGNKGVSKNVKFQLANQKQQPLSNILPKRTTKTSQKLAIFPEDIDPLLKLEDEDDVYDQINQIQDTIPRNKAVYYSKQNKANLPRVTAYLTANSYDAEGWVNVLKKLKSSNGCVPKKFDECIYSPFRFNNHKSNESETVLDITLPGIGEIFLFDYGVTVFWGLTLEQEQYILELIKDIDIDRIDEDDMEIEEFHFHYDNQDLPKIYNDVITLKQDSNYIIKLTISHAIAQSTKMALFEGLVTSTIEDTKHIPQKMAIDGKVDLSRTNIAKKIGQLYIMKINVNLVSNLLDVPEIFWSEPQLEPLYDAIRGYLEIPQRVELLNQRVDVIADMLDMLREHLNSSHGEFLEWIVIILIAVEIAIGIITIVFEAMNYARGSKYG